MLKFPFIKVSSRYERAAEKLRPQVKLISALDNDVKRLSDGELAERVAKWKGKELATIREHTNEIFACVREASARALKMRHFDVQILGGLALLDGSISEMKTGEGKTLVATLPLVLHALAGKGAHLVTVNDYLSQRDADWMRPVYEFFGLTVGTIHPGQSPEEKRFGYGADITYATNNELGFDYLRDNMATRPEDLAQRPLNYAIVDEVDSILIDEARTPLIISAPDTESTQLYQKFAQLVPTLEENEHYNIDEKRRAASLTDDGISHVEDILHIENIYAEQGVRMVHHLEQALRAQTLYHRDKDYVVKDGQVIIVDEFTGRLMEGRRYSEGLHQAIEAKEKVKVQQESRTLATITFQNFFRLYECLSGMTGTAVTSAEEFEKVYNLDVIVVPTNQVLVRQDKPDRIYMTEKAKMAACVKEIQRRHEHGQPVLVGTVAIEKSEYLSALLQREGVPHEVLNAKQHEREAEIVANAGGQGAVTISTNMAGRGTDIKLGKGVADLGGLFVLGTERHEARRIDNQLRGRSGRQGDPGETQFFVSLEDDVMRIFGGEKMQSLMRRLKVPENEAIENRMVNRAIEGAQERVEGYYFDMRKQVLSYDDVLSRQRAAIYTIRKSILTEGQWREPKQEPIALDDKIDYLIDEFVRGIVGAHTADKDIDNWNLEEIAEVLHSLIGTGLEKIHGELLASVELLKEADDGAARETLTQQATKLLKDRLEQRRSELGDESLTSLERAAAMRSIDTHWMDHLDTMDYLRTGIGLRGYGQRDPLVEYQKEGYELFQRLLTTIKTSIIEVVFKAEAVRQERYHGQAQHRSAIEPHQMEEKSGYGQAATIHNQMTDKKEGSQTQLANKYKDIGRNDPCPCGSGKKFKKCHGAE